MTNYAIIVRNTQPNTMADAKVIPLSDADFEAISIIINRGGTTPPPPPPQVKRIMITWTGGATIRADHYTNSQYIRLAPTGQVLEYTDTWETFDKSESWVKVIGGWVCVNYKGSIRAEYV